MQDCVIDAARDGSAAENRAHWMKKTTQMKTKYHVWIML